MAMLYVDQWERMMVDHLELMKDKLTVDLLVCHLEMMRAMQLVGLLD